MTESKLYRAFRPVTNMFEIDVAGKTYTDHDITSITITHGSSGAHPSFTPSSAEFGVLGAVNIPRNSPLSIRMGAEFATRIVRDTPSATGGQVRNRFNGRKALSELDDQQWSRNGAPAKWESKVTASSWTSLLRNAERSFSPSLGQNMASVLVSLMNHPDLSEYIPVSYPSLSQFEILGKDDPFLTFSEAAGKYADDMHTLLQHRRGGTVRILPITQRRDDLNATGPLWTLPRAHVLSPAKWSSPSEAATNQYSVTYTSSPGVPYTMDWPLGKDVSVVALKSENVDLEHSQRTTDAISLIMNATNIYTNVSRYGVDSVTIDLALLWRQYSPSSLRTLGSVLNLEAGDPIHLGADWPQAVRGPYFANQIKETISPDAWTITLELSHARYVLGLFDDELPTPLPIIWDAAGQTTWNTYPGTWNG